MALPTKESVETANRRPMGWALVVVTALLTTAANQLIKTNDDRSADCMENVDRLWTRVNQLEAQIDKYTTTIMALRGANSKLADSLATKGGQQ